MDFIFDLLVDDTTLELTTAALVMVGFSGLGWLVGVGCIVARRYWKEDTFVCFLSEIVGVTFATVTFVGVLYISVNLTLLWSEGQVLQREAQAFRQGQTALREALDATERAMVDDTQQQTETLQRAIIAACAREATAAGASEPERTSETLRWIDLRLREIQAEQERLNASLAARRCPSAADRIDERVADGDSVTDGWLTRLIEDSFGTTRVGRSFEFIAPESGLVVSCFSLGDGAGIECSKRN